MSQCVLTPVVMVAVLSVYLDWLLDYANICSLSWHGQKTKDIFWVTHIQTQTIDLSATLKQ